MALSAGPTRKAGTSIPAEAEAITYRFWSSPGGIALPAIALGLITFPLVAWISSIGTEDAKPTLVALVFFVVVFGIPALALAARRFTFDAEGVHRRFLGRERVLPWPQSRTDFYAHFNIGHRGIVFLFNMVTVGLVTESGFPVSISPLTWIGFGQYRIEGKAVAEATRIWEWALSRGYTSETHRYIELAPLWRTPQMMRESQEFQYKLR